MSESDPPPTGPGQPASPRSPRQAAAAPAPPPGGLIPPPTLPPGTFMAPPPQRPNLGSMLFLTAFFFFMSGNNQVQQPMEIGEDGRFVPRVTELDVARELVDEYKGWMNGTGNWTEAMPPVLRPESLIPSRYDHDPIQGPFFTNITGFYRNAIAHPASLLDHTTQPSAKANFFGELPNLNTSSWNETLAEELRGSWDWASVARVDFNLKERTINGFDGHPNSTFHGWTWVRGGLTLYQPGTDTDSSRPLATTKQVDLPTSDDGQEGQGNEGHESGKAEVDGGTSVEYDVYGLHHVRNGTYRLYGMPDGKRVDIRRLPMMFEGVEDHDLAQEVVLLELEKDVRSQRENLLLMDAKSDSNTVTSCPVLIYMTVPPLPHGTSPQELERYDQEVSDPTGIRLSMPKPPNYWDGVGLGGVIVADQCGVAVGFEGGVGIRIDDFWKKSINYATFATILQLTLLLLLVRQMESTRTPSLLSKVSLWTIVIMGVTDSWVFSAHVVMGILSDSRSSIGLLVPGFLGLCSAVVFGPRYAVLLHRIQAPERVSSPPPNRVIRPVPVNNTNPPIPSETASTPAPTSDAPPATGAPTPTTPTPASLVTPITPGPTTPTRSEDDRPFTLREFIYNNPGVRFILALGLFFFFIQIAFLPSILPFFVFGMYSFWVPQIWRNARRGSNGAFDNTFILGTSIARLGLPLYVFGCPDNIFFVKSNRWVWTLVLWQIVQVGVLFAQERFGPVFFLPKRFHPADTYNYHPLFPSSSSSDPSTHTHTDVDIDLEGQTLLSTEEKTCSICMEEVDTSPGPSSEVLLGMNRRRSYAVAPCHHLFHTKCLAQWLAIKTICPLCKRSLPPL